MKTHKIGWLNIPGYIPQTWNPIVGCSKISEGCRNCYAERMAKRQRAMGTRGYTDVTDGSGRFNGIISIVGLEDTLQKPLGWKKPRAIFVNSMGDLFHENTPDEWIDRVFAVMALCPQHLFIVLTKRAARMEKYITSPYRAGDEIFKAICEINAERMNDSEYWAADHNVSQWPLPNVWLGVTAENQAAADQRIPHLLRTPAAVRFVSCEPLIGPVDLAELHGGVRKDYGGVIDIEKYSAFTDNLDWIICGGESGPGARPMNPEWARSLRDQAQAAGVPFFFKQWGRFHGGYRELPVTHSDLLEGKQWHQWPVL